MTCNPLRAAYLRHQADAVVAAQLYWHGGADQPRPLADPQRIERAQIEAEKFFVYDYDEILTPR